MEKIEVKWRINELDKRIEELRDELWDLRKKRADLESEIVDLEGKYVSYSLFKDDDAKHYLYVTETFKNGPEFIVRGNGFIFNYGSYSDNNYAEYDAFMTITLRNDEAGKLEEELQHFTIISKEEYVSKMKEMSDNLVNNAMAFINKSEKKDG